MKIFKKFPDKAICPICGKNTPGKCTMVPKPETKEGFNVECEIVHIDCIDLEMFQNETILYFLQIKEKEFE